MKIFAGIFSFYILFLAVFPSFMNLKAEESAKQVKNSCCHSMNCEKKKAEQKTDNDCPKGKCTPFFGCTKMHVVIPTASVIPSAPDYSDFHISHAPSQYFSPLTSVWHPPKSA